MTKKLFIIAILFASVAGSDIQAAAGSGTTELSQFENLLKESTATSNGLLDAFINLNPSERADKNIQAKLVGALLSKDAKPDEATINALSNVKRVGGRIPLFFGPHPLMQWLRNKDDERNEGLVKYLRELYELSDKEPEQNRTDVPNVVEEPEYPAPLEPTTGPLFADADPAQFQGLPEDVQTADVENRAPQEELQEIFRDADNDMVNNAQIVNAGSRPIYLRVRNNNRIDMKPVGLRQLGNLGIYELPAGAKVVISTDKVYAPYYVRFWPDWIKLAYENLNVDADNLESLAYKGIIVNKNSMWVLNHNNPKEEIPGIANSLLKHLDQKKYSIALVQLDPQSATFNQFIDQLKHIDSTVYNTGLGAVRLNHPTDLNFEDVVFALVQPNIMEFMAMGMEYNPSDYYPTMGVFGYGVDEKRKEESLFDKLLRVVR